MNICVYAASGRELDAVYFHEARELGRLIALGGHSLVFGGGKEGLMGACAEGAASEGGSIIGIAPRFFDEPGVLYEKCSEFIYTDTMRQRKQLMEEMADAFVMLPGGIGTFEEFFEILTLKQLGRHAKPIAVLNTAGYYEPMLAMLRHTAKQRFMSEKCLELFSLCSSPLEAIEHAGIAEALSVSIYRFENRGG